MNLNFQDSKGQLGGEGILVIIVLLVFALISVFGYQAFDELNTDIQNDTSLSNQSKAIVDDINTRYPSTIDGMFTIIMTLLVIFLVVMSRYAAYQPILMFIPLILIVFSLVAAMLLSNVWDEITDSDSITFETSFPVMNWTLDNLMLVILATGVLVSIAMFTNNGGFG